VGFIGLHVWADRKVANRSAIIVYNVSKYRALDIVEKNTYLFLGDSILTEDGYMQNFHLNPSRVALQLQKQVNRMNHVFISTHFLQVKTKVLLLIDSTFNSENYIPKKIDVVILSQNAAVQLAELGQKFRPETIVFDGSNNLWKIAGWKSECEELHLPC